MSTATTGLRQSANFDESKAKAFAGQMLSALNGAALATARASATTTTAASTM